MYQTLEGRHTLGDAPRILGVLSGTVGPAGTPHAYSVSICVYRTCIGKHASVSLRRGSVWATERARLDLPQHAEHERHLSNNDIIAMYSLV